MGKEWKTDVFECGIATIPGEIESVNISDRHPLLHYVGNLGGRSYNRGTDSVEGEVLAKGGASPFFCGKVRSGQPSVRHGCFVC